jgi:ABC-type transport system involved in multi-copper enzyme maturation permease subunit
MFQIIFVVFSVVAAFIHLALSSRSRGSKAAVVRTFLLYLLFIYVGWMGLLTAYAHVFRPAETSASIGWSTSPYEYEVGMADLTVGVLGILCLWLRGNFWLATAIANAVWLLGDAVGHMREMALRNNHARNNSGIFLVAEIVTPIVILILALYHHARRSGVQEP